MKLRYVATVVALTALTAACGQVPSSNPNVTDVVISHATEAGNRTATEHEVRRLLSLARVPKDALPRGGTPICVAHGSPLLDPRSHIEDGRKWTVAESMGAAFRFISAQRPDGLDKDGPGYSGDRTGITSRDFQWYEPDRSYAVQLSLSISVGRTAHGRSTIHATAEGTWLDPQPIQDSYRGRRLRVSIDNGCPASDEGFHDVSNTGTDLGKRLLPNATPTFGLICQFSGLKETDNPSLDTLTRAEPLSGQNAQAIANEANNLSFGHVPGSGVTSCPPDTGEATVVALSYPGRPDVDLWTHQDGCQSVGNGFIFVPAGLDLSEFVTPLPLM